jgi:hypothetical protein
LPKQREKIKLHPVIDDHAVDNAIDNYQTGGGSLARGFDARERATVDSAIAVLRRAVQSGFICAPTMLRSDAWLSAARAHPDFPSVLTESQTLVREAESELRGCAAWMPKG